MPHLLGTGEVKDFLKKERKKSKQKTWVMEEEVERLEVVIAGWGKAPGPLPGS